MNCPKRTAAVTLIAFAAVVLGSSPSHAAAVCTIESTYVTVAGQTVRTPTISYPCP
jgi:hypothetical protein